MDLGLMRELIPVLGSYFPETLFKLYLVNTGLIIRSFYSALKSVLNERTTNKVWMLINIDKSSWK